MILDPFHQLKIIFLVWDSVIIVNDHNNLKNLDQLLKKWEFLSHKIKFQHKNFKENLYTLKNILGMSLTMTIII
jgi:hypothetical protein